ncbi:Glycosyl transferase family 1 [Macrophomina phaseolina MS6]|uniref:alpha-1,3-glucan synthase n=1 Tax=Macrophomina phaseolina (strain MS6) TaxID=1126212 RepID=K2RKX1_MACPH|nr:Glycosyl transferase family 1 [Macrophomina phaseolina MS6]
MTFSAQANDTEGPILWNEETESFYLAPCAAGAEKIRHSCNWASSWSLWLDYIASNLEKVVLEDRTWAGAVKQRWQSEHVVIEYWSHMAASSHHAQHADLDTSQMERRWPHAFVQGTFNELKLDVFTNAAMMLHEDGVWKFNLSAEWPVQATISVWEINPDGLRENSIQFGDISGNGALDLLPSDSLVQKVFNITAGPGMPYVGWQIAVHDGNFAYHMTPIGSASAQRVLFFFLAVFPVLIAAISAWAYKISFYSIEQIGLTSNRRTCRLGDTFRSLAAFFKAKQPPEGKVVPELRALLTRRRVLMATLEYSIDDWDIHVRIGGLGVMASLATRVLGHQDLIWVIPCLGDIHYPFAAQEAAEPIILRLCDRAYRVDVYCHVQENITFILLDAPVFRQRTRGAPYPVRMDDLESAIFYSAWNACIAECLRRFPVDLYHINDFHGALAPLHLLPHQTVPVALSLHNAEFQGSWPLKTPEECNELAALFDISPRTMREYVRFGDIFNPLHAAVRYVQRHQRGFGVVAVSAKYAWRAHARYPVFWSLPSVGSLSNPDPSDLRGLPQDDPCCSSSTTSADNESQGAQTGQLYQRGDRASMLAQTQQWAGLETNCTADLFVFVGRWCKQKGIDLIADVFPSILAAHISAQLICLGPIVDLHGRLAAMKLDATGRRFPGRVCAIPHFVTPPLCLFRATEFVLIPSRDEPFGLVAVEFGRKGALGIGPRIGGLGQMPGWWYNAESMETRHLLSQLKATIRTALGSSKETRRLMRAEAEERKFPVAEWVQGLEALQGEVIRLHEQERGPCTEGLRWGGSTAVQRAYNSASEESLLIQNKVSASSGDTLLDEKQLPSLELEKGISERFTGSDIPYLSIDAVVCGHGDFELQKCPPVFTDADGEYQARFAKILAADDGTHSSQRRTCISDFIYKGEKEWFRLQQYGEEPDNLQLPVALSSTPALWLRPMYTWVFSTKGYDAVPLKTLPHFPSKIQGSSEFRRSRLMYRIGSWPLYSILIALGQILSVDAFQITLLTGRGGETATRVYATSSVFLIGSICWWSLFRMTKTVYTISLPFLFFGLSFLLLTVALVMPSSLAASWIQQAAVAAYAFGSAAGAMFLTLNFSTEGKRFTRLSHQYL